MTKIQSRYLKMSALKYEFSDREVSNRAVRQTTSMSSFTTAAGKKMKAKTASMTFSRPGKPKDLDDGGTRTLAWAPL